MLLEEAEESGADEQTPDIKRILSAGKHLLTLVTGVLDLSKLEANKMELYPERFELGRLIDDVRAACEDEVTANSNRFVVRCPDPRGTLETDMAKLRQAVMNIVSNAAKFTRGGTVTLTAHIKDGFAEIAVRDTGIGIREENLANLFQNFGEAQGATSSKYGGTGLGLALSQKLCRLMGGSIAVQSELGKGSCFTISVPVTLAAALQKREPFRPDPGDDRDAVLIIDSDPALADSLQGMLAEAGYRPMTASSAEVGLTLAKAATPAVILLGALKPEGDGWVVVQGLKSDPALRTTQLILLTSQQDAPKGWAFGASGHLTKPINPEQLLAVLKRAAAERA
jgi:CheY-like chemotaxis protein/anti-sigma regulatory factor (Ser/Thr protein kinase)